jgi:small-conductance mechanosensitive channel
MTAKSLAGVKVKLQTKIRKLEGKDKLSAEEKTELKNIKRQLKDVENEMAEESTKAGRSMQQKARDRKSKPVSLKEDLPPLKSEMQKGGMLKKPTADQKGLKKLPTAVRNKMGYMKRGGMMKSGNNDMRKGGMFYK